jgi:hypothetical protein
MEPDDNWVKSTLLYHLRRKRVIGGKHTSFDILRRGFPSHLGKDVKKITEELIKQGFIITKSTSYGLQVSLNKENIREIDEFIFRVLGFRFD